MSLNIETVPIEQWPGKLRTWRNAAPFRTTFSATVDLLERELSKIGAKDVVIQMALKRSDIRLDGKPRADARPSHPGVILSFTNKRGSFSFPCDCYSDWHDNVRAIALSLEALRKVDRYGVTQNSEQYKGWMRLEGNGQFTAESARTFLRSLAGLAHASDDELLRAAWKLTHPDVGGDPEKFKQVELARKALNI